MANKYYVVTAIAQYRMRYAIPVEDLRNEAGRVDPVWASDSVIMGEVDEFSQLHLGETIIDVQEVDEEEILDLFDRDNDYLKGWTREKKLDHIRDWRFK